jgi:hypothetical protein
VRLRSTRLTAVSKGTSSSSIAWQPNNLSGLSFWFDAADSSKIILNGSTVSQWTDKSGNNRNATQSTASRQPTFVANAFNGKPTLRGTRAGITSLNIPAFTLGTQIHVFAITNAATSGTYQYMMGQDANSGYALCLRAEATGEDWIAGDVLAFGSGFPQINNPRAIGPYTWGEPKLFYAALGTTTSTAEVFATKISTRKETLATGALSNTAMALFSNSPNGTQNLEGDISECFFIAGSLSALDKQKAEGYLAWKWS